MSMDGEILQRLADHEARLKALEVKAGLRQADGGTMAVAMTGAAEHSFFLPHSIVEIEELQIGDQRFVRKDDGLVPVD